jgi:hypothetical protein
MNRNYLSLGRAIAFLFLTAAFLAIDLSLAKSQEISYNPISTAVPFLTITPDSRHGGMGDVGAATSPDANSQYLNPAKYAFVDGKFGVSVSYTPWLRNLVSDINLAYLAGYYQIDKMQTLGASLRYFSIGDISLEDINGMDLGNLRPNEFALDFSYSRKLSDYFSGGIALRYIRTDLNGGYSQESYSAGNALASDISFFYNKKFYSKKWQGASQPKTFAAGINFSNIGSKISYNGGQSKEFLPANMRLGATFTNEFNEINSLSVSLDVNKLLVPTPIQKETVDNTGNVVVVTDTRSNVSVPEALFSSFSDAPGGLNEELQEYNLSAGLEYWYNHRFALRTGYFNESENKGNRKFFTAGLGVKINICSIDFSYLMPVQQNNPLASTLRFTISFYPDSFKKEKKAKDLEGKKSTVNSKQ